MTAFELVKYMAMLRGSTLHELNDRVSHMLAITDLTKYSNVIVRKYSGGTKRKLSTALAMVIKRIHWS